MAEGALGIPSVSVAAYQNAERILAVEKPNCNMHWTLLAGIGRVESGHANDGKDADANGNLYKPVIGPPLNGSLPGQAIMDTDGGALDGDTVYDRAVGPCSSSRPRGTNTPVTATVTESPTRRTFSTPH